MSERDDLLRTLVSADDPVYADWPRGREGYDRRESEERFERFAANVVELLGGGCRIETGALIQDASFVGQVILRGGEEVTAIRVSHFGPFVAVLDDEGVLDSEVLVQVQAVAAAHGYTWIPSQMLEEPYTGDNPGVTGFSTWRHRFFDWI